MAVGLGLRAALFALLWWVLTGGATDSWPVGAVIVVIALLVTLGLSPFGPGRLSLIGLLRFLPFFLWHSLKGGVDVATRAFRPSLPIDPCLVDYRLRLSSGPEAVFMVNVASLLPGTLAARLDRDRLQVHVLDQRGDFRRELEALERRVADLFGASLRAREPEV